MNHFDRLICRERQFGIILIWTNDLIWIDLIVWCVSVTVFVVTMKIVFSVEIKMKPSSIEIISIIASKLNSCIVFFCVCVCQNQEQKNKIMHILEFRMCRWSERACSKFTKLFILNVNFWARIIVDTYFLSTGHIFTLGLCKH